MRDAVLVVLLLGVPAFGFAQDTPEVATEVDIITDARTLFARGVEHASAGDFVQAERAFQQALELHPAPAIEYNLARALVELGEYAAAYTHAASVAAGPETDVQRDAETLRTQLRPRIALLSIALGGEADGVRLDGQELAPSELAHVVAVMPGSHEVVGLRAGEEVTRRPLQLEAGMQAVVDVSVIPSPREAALQDTSRSSSRSSNMGLVVGVVAASVVAVVIVVIVAVVLGGSTQSPVSGNFEPGVIRW